MQDLGLGGLLQPRCTWGSEICALSLLGEGSLVFFKAWILGLLDCEIREDLGRL